MNAVTFAILGYVAVQLAVGAWISRRVRTESDYLVAGRSLGPVLATASIFATWFGAETCVGAAGEVYTHGLAGATADPFGYTICLLVMGLVFAVPLWKLRLTTIADFIRMRYSPGVERLAVLLMVPTSLLWAAAQIRAFGQVLSSSSGLAAEITIAVAAGVVIVYTMSGGLLADAWTDVVQGIALILGLAVLFVAVVAHHGVDTFRAIEPASWHWAKPGESFLDRAEAWAIPIFGSALAGELAARVFASRSPQIAKRSALVAAAVYLVVGLVPVVLGLVATHALPGLATPEHALPELARQYLPTALYAVFAGALVSAILSTVDSALLVASSLTSHNLVARLRPSLTDAGRLRVARLGVAFFGIAAYVIALHSESVFALTEEASAFGSAGVFVVIALGLFWKRGTARAAFAALACGILAWLAGAYVFEVRWPYLGSLFAAVAAYVLVSAPRAPAPIPATTTID